MLRRAIISDIHGNLPALEAVLADIQTQLVDDIVCLGDICGYGAQPVECIQEVRKAVSWCLLGNHDEAIFKEPVDFSRNAYDAVVWQRGYLDPQKIIGASPSELEAAQERWNWLKSLSPMRIEKNVRFVHASPRDPIHEYVMREDFDEALGGPTEAACEIMANIDWLCFCGHSHRPGVVAEDYKWWLPDELPGGKSMIRSGFKTLVNVGSVGQPRDGHPEACYVIFEYDPPKDPPPPPPPSSVPATRPQSSSTIVMRKPPSVPAPAQPVTTFNDEETRGEKDGELQQARETILLLTPKVFFRRVAYNVHDAQQRIYAFPDLPRYNGIRLAMGK